MNALNLVLLLNLISPPFDADIVTSAVPLKRNDKRDAQIARIVDAARVCFLRSGFHGASMQEICNEADMSPGALYRYFSSKESLIEAICAIHRAEDAKILMTIHDHPSVAEGLVLSLIAHIQHVHQSGFAPLFAEIFAESQRSEAMAEICNRSMLQARQMIRAGLERGLERKEIAPVLPLDQLLDIMMAAGHGIVTHDLPRHGMTMADIEIVVRNLVFSVIRPISDHENKTAIIQTHAR